MAEIGTKKAIQALIDIVKVKGKNYEAAISRLGNIKAKEAIPILINLVERDADESIRSKSITALGKIGGKEAIPSIIDIIKKDDSPRV